MGLRLYQAPVESDIQSKPAAEKTSAQARSSIRRGQYRSSSLAPGQALARDRRRRLAIAAAAASSGQPFHPSVFYGDRNRSPQPEAPTPGEPSASTDGNASAATPDNGRHNGRRALRNMAARLGVLDNEIVAVFADRWAHLHTETNPNPQRDEEDNDRLSIMAVEPDFLPRRRLPSVTSVTSVTEPYATSSIRSTQAPGHPSRTSGRSYARRRYAEGLRDSPRPPAPSARDQPRLVVSRPDGEFVYGTRMASFDGLGDRNRSLSPEGDNVWDTLLTTLTPDPQPPSVGSSFASASASAAASHGAATISSRTSFAGPDTVEESFEPPCESGCENSDTEGDDDDEQNPLTRFPAGLRTGRRSYADVTRSVTSTEDSPLDTLGGMQRIVSNLARREDIPDEWWLEAGLSRTLSREASSG